MITRRSPFTTCFTRAHTHTLKLAEGSGLIYLPRRIRALTREACKASLIN